MGGDSLTEVEKQNEKRTKLHIVRDVLEVAHYPCTKTYLYRHSDADWYRFSNVFRRLLIKEWLTMIVDKGGNGDLFSITSKGKKYFEKLRDFLSSVE